MKKLIALTTLLITTMICTPVYAAQTPMFMSEPQTLQTLYGPSHAFLEEFGEDTQYVLKSNKGLMFYDVYASGVLDDGTIVFAANKFECIAITPEGTLVVGEWGEGFIPKKVFSDYTFEPAN